ncbi:hypothetical protein FB567DRAFT_474898 [Paraphoma chrysanthemicola]|uniref:Alpha-ketoglutarate-dependent sulfonate dioxygenase n=1 Tax=Paraphoma chrysanthemicola TaxID=798071 RepID=A0A8K0R274_9PLEO|nr:hypothetical protein FB567DRAFT_474898 [Paraphoma chrysanthemicola]
MVKVQDPDTKLPLTGAERTMNGARQVSMKTFEEQYAEPPPYSSQPPSAETSTSNVTGSTTASRSLPTADELNFQLSPLEIPTPAECIAHLKLLHAFAKLRRDVGNRENLFGISLGKAETKDQQTGRNAESSATNGDAQPDGVHEQNAERVAVETHVPETAATPDIALAERIRDKRWAVFVHQAVDRFEAWWNSISTTSSVFYSTIKQSDFETSDWSYDGKPIISRFTTQGDGLDANGAQFPLPPLDVLMVWHAFMLNPRVYLEDCIRYSKHRLWRTWFPWEVIHRAIDNETFEYAPNDVLSFRRDTKRRWDPLQQELQKHIKCPKCESINEVPWTQPPLKTTPEALEAYLAKDTGFAGTDFRHSCMSCGLVITHERLRVGKFCDDADSLMDGKRPLAGTILNMWGIPTGTAKGKKISTHEPFFPNRAIENKSDLRSDFLRENVEQMTVEGIKRTFSNLLRSRYEIMYVNAKQNKSDLVAKGSRVAIRKVLSHYWDNSSIFGIDLVGAVLRQGTFVQKMAKMDWLHSPSAMPTMQRLIVKYHRFVRLAADHPKKTVVPTLDVDLAWHTHQLSPQIYYRYTLAETTKFLNHDDKIPESNLHTSFQWTSQAYEKKYGQPYSECSCWYCECTREPLRSNFLSKISSRRSSLSVDKLDSKGFTKDAFTGPHISAHNALPTSSSFSPDNNTLTPAAHRAALEALDLTYAKVVKRYQKQKAVPPSRSKDDKYDAYVYSAYGYPYIYPMPIYIPYAADPSVASHTAGGGGGGGACAVGTCCTDASAGNCAGGEGTPGCAAACGGHGDAGGGCGTCGSGGDGGGGDGGDGGGCGGCGG